jgi:hypothetical protein
MADGRSGPARTPERKVRTPQGGTPCESRGALNESSLRRKVSQKTNRFDLLQLFDEIAGVVKVTKQG